MPPAATQTPSRTTETGSGEPQSRGSGKQPKYATAEERRKAIARALKERWASGAMAHVHEKRLETMRRRKEAEALSVIEMATPDRPYAQYEDEDGALKSACGALIPEGYQLDTSVPTHPWVCPIRSCRKLFQAVLPLGAHFLRAHRGIRLHDNNDGTFTQRDRLPKSTSKPVVVSRGPPDPSDPPPVAPSLPTPHDEESHEPRGDSEELWRYVQPFLTKHKGPTPPTQGWLPCLLSLPRLREPDWNVEWLTEHPYKDSQPRDIGAVLIQITGEPAPNPCNRCSERRGPFRSCVMISPKADTRAVEVITCCANCYYHCTGTYCSHNRWGAERSKKIIKDQLAQLHRSRHPEKTAEQMAIAEEVELQQRRKQKGANHEERQAGEMPGHILATKEGKPYDVYRQAEGENEGDDSMFGTLLPSGYQPDKTVPGRPWRVHYGAILNDNQDGTFTVKGYYADQGTGLGNGGKILKPAPPIVASKEPLRDGSPVPPAQLPPYLRISKPPAALAGTVVPFETRQPNERPTAAVVPSPSRRTRCQANMSSALLFKGESTGQEDVLEMEEWEAAPGRIRETNGSGDNIAFSKPYLSSTRPVPVCEDVGFHVDTIPSGGTLQLEAESDKMRLCSVAAGKVRVTIGSEPEFVVGPHGMFKVKAGVTCTVRNGLHLDAVLHTTILEGYL
ncbi:hypothetical protein VTJ49DRAFT_3207 [Mycothermus thermophilus]|uniref:C2H2-type domain-containing protein n=1 Tax=Humicola insolens TaxID=85995 RepID=A0ABR3VMI9_HUMIN